MPVRLVIIPLAMKLDIIWDVITTRAQHLLVEVAAITTDIVILEEVFVLCLPTIVKRDSATEIEAIVAPAFSAFQPQRQLMEGNR